ncbi:MAG: hypothetical protein U0270_02110 [Labilithrix sp.]
MAAIVTSVLAVRCLPSEDHRPARAASSDIETASDAAKGTTCKGATRLFSGSIRDHVVADGDRLYWMHEPAARGARPRLESAAKDGGAPQIHDVAFETSTASLGGVDDTHLYFIDGLKVVRVAKTALAAANPERETVHEAQSEATRPLELRLDGSVFYLLAGAPKSVLLAIPKGSGPTRQLLSKLSNPKGLTLFGDTVYFLSGPDPQAVYRARRVSTDTTPADVAATVPVDDLGIYGSEDNILAGGGIVYRYDIEGDQPIIKVPRPYGIRELFLNGGEVFFTLVETNKPDTALRASIRSASRSAFHEPGKELVKALHQPTSIFFDERFAYFTENNPGGGGLFQVPRETLGTAPIACQFVPDDTLDAFGAPLDGGLPAASDAGAGAFDAATDAGSSADSGVAIDDAPAPEDRTDAPEDPSRPAPKPTSRETNDAGAVRAPSEASWMCSSIGLVNAGSNALPVAAAACLAIALVRRRSRRPG